MSESLTRIHNHTKTCAQSGVHVLFTCPGASNVWPGGWMSACLSLCPAYAFSALLPLPALPSSSLHPLWALCSLPPLCLLKRTLSVLTAPLHLACFSLSLLQIPALSLALVYCCLAHKSWESERRATGPMKWSDAKWANGTELVTGVQEHIWISASYINSTFIPPR